MAGSDSRAPRSRRAVFLAGVVGGVFLVAAILGGEAAISTTEFCVSCHSMSYAAEELKKSSHYAALGTDPGCKDCHIPQGLANFHLALYTHTYDGVRGVYNELTHDYSTIQKFNARRLEAAQVVRMNLKRWDSVTCRACHSNTRPPGESARDAHKKMQTKGATCIDCHQNLVHKEVEETDLDKSLAQGKMVMKEAE
jgi:nitrate/TMAO reductase-like tetraheme cytochrome c subunit